MSNPNPQPASEPMNLDNIDAVVVLDKSGSMGDPSHLPNKTRWQAGEESISALSEELAAHDDDGITVVPFADSDQFGNGKSYHIEDGVTPDRVEQVFKQFRPGGGTYLAPALAAVIDRFIPPVKETQTRMRKVPRKVLSPNQPVPKEPGFWAKLLGSAPSQPEPVYDTVYDEVPEQVPTGRYTRQSPKKQVFIAVYTDGAAGDEAEVVRVITDATRRITSRRDLGILFIQVGKDPQATAFLQRLNDRLSKDNGGDADFDIVAVTSLESLERLTVEDTIRLAYTA